jgi:gas vesicle protein GvpL/GvpF
MALRLHGITFADAHLETAGDGTGTGSGTGTGTWSGTLLVPFRDLCAVVSEQKVFAIDAATPADVERHRAVVDWLFRRVSVLPAPVGVVFRAPEVLRRWLELHYVSLTGALEFVDDRAAARVHVVRADGKPEDLETGSDLASSAAEAMRALRRHAVASVPLRHEEVTGLVLSSSFLVERDLWNGFLSAVKDQRDAHHLLRFEVTGPWAPYDFVQMQFGG